MRRRRWIAATLSLLQPGLGQIYNGQIAKGVLLYLALLAFGAVSVALMLWVATSAWIFLLFAGLLTAALVGVVLDAVRDAHRSDDTLPLRWYSRWYGYIGLLLLAVFVLQPVVFKGMKKSIAESFVISSSSMAPALMEGDYVMVNRIGRNAPVAGEVIEFSWADRSRARYIKRVVAVGGDTIEMRDRTLLVNGIAVSEPYVQFTRDDDFFVPAMFWQREFLVAEVDSAAYAPSNNTWGPLVVPDGHFFVLGDSRDESEDSRHRGFVREEWIGGQGGRLYFSRDPETGNWRTSRIGLAVQ